MLVWLKADRHSTDSDKQSLMETCVHFQQVFAKWFDRQTEYLTQRAARLQPCVQSEGP